MSVSPPTRVFRGVKITGSETDRSVHFNTWHWCLVCRNDFSLHKYMMQFLHNGIYSLGENAFVMTPQKVNWMSEVHVLGLSLMLMVTLWATEAVQCIYMLWTVNTLTRLLWISNFICSKCWVGRLKCEGIHL